MQVTNASALDETLREGDDPPMFAVLAPLALFIVCLPVVILALRVGRPDSRWISVVWWLLLVGACLWFARSLILPAHPLQFEVMPYRTHVATFLFVMTPFLLSFLLARTRAGTWGVVLLVGYCIAVAFGMRALNETCIYYDFHHDDGEAWCGESWQAGWRKRGPQPWND